MKLFKMLEHILAFIYCMILYNFDAGMREEIIANEICVGVTLLKNPS